MSIRKKVADIRIDYLKDALAESNLLNSPIEQFEKWFEEAVAHVMEPNAMTLSTVHDGQPSSRIVLLKGFDESGFVFYTNYKSKKGKEMAGNTKVALTFFWPELERQVRIEGIVEKVSGQDSSDYYHSRGKGSQIGAWASPQSEVIPNRELLEKRVEQYEKEFEGKEIIPRPEHWGGYRVKPHYLEFWQGRKSRLHDRIAYVLEDDSWKKDRLAP